MAGRRARLTLELAPLLHQCVLHAAGWSRAEFSLVGNLSATRGAHDSTQPLLTLLLAAVLPGRTGAWGGWRAAQGCKTHTLSVCSAAVGCGRWPLMTPRSAPSHRW